MPKVLLFLAAVWLSAACAYGESDGTLIARSIQAYEQIESIRNQMQDAVRDLADEKRSYELAMRELNAGTKDRAQLQALSDELARHQKTLDEAGHDAQDESIAYSKRRVRDLTLMLKAGSLQTDRERQAFRQSCQPRIERLTKKIQTLEKPYQQRIFELQESSDAENDQLTELIRPYIKTPVPGYHDATVQHVSATVHMAFGSSNWNSRDDKQIAWAHIRIRSLEEIEDNQRRQLLDGKYPIQSLSDGSIWVWAGHFLVTFVADDEKLKGKDNLQQAIRDFIDLDGLASIQVESNRVASGDVAE